MQTLQNIPRVLEKIEDLHKFSNSDQLLAQYKRNFKQFVQALTNELSQLIDKYESKIKQLAKQNQRLRQTWNYSQRLTPIKKSYGSPKKTVKQSYQYKCLDNKLTASTNTFGIKCVKNVQHDALFSTVLGKFKKNDEEDGNFPIELISGSPSNSKEADEKKSRFKANNNVKKQKQEELRHYLEARSKNLQKTTRQIMTALGRNKKQDLFVQSNNNDQFNPGSDNSLQIKKINHNLNKSLGDICQSLDTSFHSKKARSKNLKKKQQIKQEIKQKKQNDEQISKKIKDRSVKNLLHKLRDNVQNSKNPPEIIKNSKLISCAKGNAKGKKDSRQNAESPTLSNRKNSKVMINPVPVEISKKSKISKKDQPSSPVSPQKKPQSILKNSTVLTRSLSGISEIQFG